MWPNSLRLASFAHVEEGTPGGKPAQPDAGEYKHPAAMVVEETSETPTPKQQVANVIGKSPTPGEHAFDWHLSM